MISDQKYLSEQLKDPMFRQAYEDQLLLAEAAIETACPLGIRRQQQGLRSDTLAQEAPYGQASASTPSPPMV